MRGGGLVVVVTAGLLVATASEIRAGEYILGSNQLDVVVAGGAARVDARRLERLRAKLLQLEARGGSEKARQRIAAAIARLEASGGGSGGGTVRVEAQAQATGDSTTTTTNKQVTGTSGAASASAEASSTGGRVASARASVSVAVSR